MEHYHVAEISEGFWSIDEGHVRFFLFEGDEEALLIDTGFGQEDLPALTASLTSRPVSVFLTHCDGDHAGGIRFFDKIFAHPSEFAPLMASGDHENTNLLPVFENTVISAGKHRLRTIHLPGHTPGATALYEETSRILISGDSISAGPIFMFGVNRNMRAHAASLSRLQGMNLSIDRIYPSHGQCPLDVAYISKTLESANAVLEGRARISSAPEMFGGACKLYEFGDVSYYI